MMAIGIKNIFIIKKARIIVGIALIISIISLMALKEASWTKTFLVFGLIPLSLFISGHFKNKHGNLVNYGQNFNQDDYEEEAKKPIIDKIERTSTTTTTTTETIYFKNADIKLLNGLWRDK